MTSQIKTQMPSILSKCYHVQQRRMLQFSITDGEL